MSIDGTTNEVPSTSSPPCETKPEPNRSPRSNKRPAPAANKRNQKLFAGSSISIDIEDEDYRTFITNAAKSTKHVGVQKRSNSNNYRVSLNLDKMEIQSASGVTFGDVPERPWYVKMVLVKMMTGELTWCEHSCGKGIYIVLLSHR